MANTLELILRRLARELADNQIAKLYKIPEEMQQTPCDFIGHTSKGRCIMIEAKMSKQRRLPLGGKGHNGLMPHQWNALKDASNAGCVALICWQHGDEVALIDLPHAAVKAGDKRSVAWADIGDEWKRPVDDLEELLAMWLGDRR